MIEIDLFKTDLSTNALKRVMGYRPVIQIAVDQQKQLGYFTLN